MNDAAEPGVLIDVVPCRNQRWYRLLVFYEFKLGMSLMFMIAFLVKISPGDMIANIPSGMASDIQILSSLFQFTTRGYTLPYHAS